MIRNGHLIWAGVLIGLVIALKPNYAVVPLILLAAGYYRIALPAVLTAAGVSAVPLLLDGPQYLSAVARPEHALPGPHMDVERLAGVRRRTSRASRSSVPLSPEPVLLAVLYVTWRIRPTALNALACGLLTVLLLGPVSWAGYTLFLLPFLFTRKWDRLTWAAVFLLAAPFSPEGAVSSVSRTSTTIPPVRALIDAGQGVTGWMSGAPSSLVTSVADPMRWLWNTPWQAGNHIAASAEPLAGAIIGSVYVWAVLCPPAGSCGNRRVTGQPSCPCASAASRRWPRPLAHHLGGNTP